ncbi:hypothetical protein N0V93_005878 [Gnomoniopsis smithogilvyi]|uniref:Uncharacterized protein n=1 Tax=Gnomoniopsis smithogilvyi TaxID=1191159 RepID=A0A9W9CXJ8_9PEZI|nr:hypothetical protein N0V93_005878 [Gnomoniopsis smithogilvyi]
MKTEHLTLPTLQVAAALFFASSAQAAGQAETYCIDTNDIIVENSNCDGTATPATFFVIDGAPGGTVGTAVEGAVGTKVDSTDKTALESAGFTSGGFGKRQTPEEEEQSAAGILVGAAS